MAASGNASSVSSEDTDLLYPELMSAKAIVKILKERYVRHPRLEELDKAALVQLYEKTVLPLPQREYRTDTRTGRALAALRERAEGRKRKASTSSESSSRAKSSSKAKHRSTDNGGKERRQSQSDDPPPAKRDKKSDDWGSWDEGEPKSKKGKTGASNSCHGDGSHRKKHGRIPITWP
ncbi:uncharacterized protein LOC144153920 isoform X2 [Haemaphysalis longicornis]